VADDLGIVLIAYSPLALGLLTGGARTLWFLYSVVVQRGVPELRKCIVLIAYSPLALGLLTGGNWTLCL
jgi:aryl-alcohol dehydrogenase-like predicted oxidoreductase